MDQLALFRPPDMLLNELHLNLGRMELVAARASIDDYAKTWGDVGLTWEQPFLDFWTVNEQPGSLDEGWSLWIALRGTTFWPMIPLSVRLGFQTSYFQAILDRTGDDGADRTPSGLSKGYLHFLAGRLDSALAFLRREVASAANDPLPHLYLGNTQFLLNDTPMARANYREALLGGLKPDDYAEILDTDLRAWLAEVEAGEWAVIELCIDGALPVARLRSRDSVAAFLARHSWFSGNSAAPPPSPVHQFYACLVISESRRAVCEDVLMKARLHMKFLNGRLHRLHMDRLDSK